MRLWIDGGSLHALPRCLRQKGVGPNVYDQLELAVQLCFAQTLVIGDYESPSYTEKTQEAVGELIKYGFESDSVEIAKTPQSKLHGVYLGAAEALARRLEPKFRDFEHIAQSCSLPPAVQLLEDTFHQAIQTELSDSDREALSERVRGVENNGLIMMLTLSTRFWQAVRSLVARNNQWNAAKSKALADLCRVYIHDEHAGLHGATYAPNWRRGKALRIPRFPNRVLKELRELGVSPETFKVGEFSLPAVANVLAIRSGGNLPGLLRQTLRVRDRTARLRKHLGKVVREMERKTDRHSYADAELNALLEDLRSQLAASKSDKRLGALELFSIEGFVIAASVVMASQPLQLHHVAGTLMVSAGISSAVKISRGRRVAVLSEMASEAKVGVSKDLLEDLRKDITRHSTKSA
jgi:hypothetical protein